MPTTIVDEQSFFYVLDDFTDPWAPGEVVLFHHGYSRNHRFWYDWPARIASRYRSLRFDMRGHGKTDPLRAGYEPSLESLAADTVGIMDALQIEKVHFVGESLAGVVGIWLGAHYPERVHSLVLLSTPVKVSDQGRADFSAGAGSWENAFDNLTPAQWARQTMGHRFDLDTTDPGYIDWAVAENAKTPVESLKSYARLIGALDLTGGVPSVNVPTLLVAGGSKLAPPEQARFLNEQIPNSELHLIPDAKHLVGYSHPEAVSALALEFWNSLR